MSDDISDLGAEAEVASRRARAEIDAAAPAAERLGLTAGLTSTDSGQLAALEEDLRAVLRGVIARRTLRGAEEILRGPAE
jgi:hypothetical protein